MKTKISKWEKITGIEYPIWSLLPNVIFNKCNLAPYIAHDVFRSTSRKFRNMMNGFPEIGLIKKEEIYGD